MLQDSITFTAKDGRHFTLRSPKLEEVQMSLDLMIEASAHSPYILSTPEVFRQKTVENQIKWFQETAASESSIMLAAFHEEHMIGFCNAGSYKDIKRKHRAALGISLLPQFRGCGLGEKMMEVLIQNIKKFSGIQIIELDVMLNNTPAVRLYEKLGFRRGGLFPKAYVLPSGEISDNLTMFISV